VRTALRNLEEIIVGTLVAAMSIVAVTNVLLRYVFSSPLPWAEEFASTCFIWLVFFGALLCTKQKRHLVVDVVLIALPARLQSIFRLVVDLFVLVLMVLLVYYGWVLMIATTQRTMSLGIPKSYIYSVVPITAALGFLYSLRDLRRDFKAAVGGGEA
jgi:TRAP-type C4-dicarboxylate transport system permease small subunit